MNQSTLDPAAAAAAAAAATLARHLFIEKAYALGCFAVYIYEYSITFGDEMSRIWGRGRSFATLLWVVNRYTLLVGYFPLLYLILGVESSTPLYAVCHHFAKYEPILQMVTNASIGTTLILRTYALNAFKKWVLALLIPLLLSELVIQSWVTSSGIPAPLPPGVEACVLIGDPRMGNLFALFWACELIFPTVVFMLTVGRVFVVKSRNGIIGQMFRDGILYFFVIFCANLLNVVTYALASPDLKAVNASLSVLLSAIMINRLTLNLRDHRTTVGTLRGDTQSSYAEGGGMGVPRVSVYGKAQAALHAHELHAKMLGPLGGDIVPDDGEVVSPPPPQTAGSRFEMVRMGAARV